jgi:hypothetical protein
MDRYDPYMHRVPVRDIIMAWAIAVTLFAVLIALPIFARTNFADTAEIGTNGAIAEIIPHDTNGPAR